MQEVKRMVALLNGKAIMVLLLIHHLLITLQNSKGVQLDVMVIM